MRATIRSPGYAGMRGWRLVLAPSSYGHGKQAMAGQNVSKKFRIALFSYVF